MLEVLDSLRRLLDSPQQILSHVRLDSTHGTSRTAMPADERKRRCAAAEKARRVRLRQAASAAETAAAQNEPLADESYKKRAKKIARNISKNTAIVIEEHYVPSFKPSKIFIDKIKKSVTSA